MTAETRATAVAVREIADDDVEQVVALWHECGLTRPWNDPRRDVADARRHPGSTVLVATEPGGAVVGSVLPGYEGHRGWLYYVAVAPARQGTGLGRALVTAGEEWLRGLGVAKVMLMVRASNVQVTGFYDRLGYDAQDVVVLGRHL